MTMQTIGETGQQARDRGFWHPLAMAFKGVAMAMAVVVIAFGILDAGSPGTYATFLAIGLFAVATGSMMDHHRNPNE